MAKESGHAPVLLEQVVNVLQPRAGEVCLDATVGRGGHAEALAESLGPGGTLVGLDLDPANVAYARQRLEPIGKKYQVQTSIERANFAQGADVLTRHGLDGVDLLLADLGFASNQMDDPRRGLSYRGDGPLDMRLDTSESTTTTAADLVHLLPERELADVIFRYGEEPLSRKIAAKIVETRAKEPIQSTKALAEVVRRAYGRRAKHSRMHPATRTFQALRIAVNGELTALEHLLQTLPSLLRPGGRAAVIGFHSLEDRPVKRRFQGLADEGGFERLTRKPIQPDEPEQAANPRSRSAKLRAIRRLE